MVGGSENGELILNFWKVITTVGIESWHLDGERNEIIDNFLDDISDTVCFWGIIDWWVENDISIL